MIVHNLPSQPTSFVGRKTEIAEIIKRVADPTCRLLTLVGPGGIGKTRLSIEVASPRWKDFKDGVYFVALQPLRSPELLTSTIGGVFGFPPDTQEDYRTQLITFLHDKNLLLVMDNFEHLLAGADLLADILQAAPDVKMLVTSREVLNLQEEWVYDVDGLRVPGNESVEALEDYDAVRLFIDRAQQIRQDFSTAGECDEIVRICQLVGGMPLAIELAASWLRAMSCADIADEIAAGLDILAIEKRNIPERHRGIRAVFEPTWRRLDDAERDVCMKLSAFRGGGTREAAEQITGAGLRMLSALVDKSLLRCDNTGRYDMHELLRQYAQEHLEARPATFEQTCDAHAAYYGEFMRRQEPRWQGSEPAEADAEISLEIDNVRAAWDWAMRNKRLDVLAESLWSLQFFHHNHGLFREAETRFRTAAVTLETEAPCGDSSILWGRLVEAQGEFTSGTDEKAVILERSVMILQASGAKRELALAMRWLGMVYQILGQWDKSQCALEESLQLARSSGDSWMIATILARMGTVAGIHMDDIPKGLLLFEESLQLFRKVEHASGIAWALAGIASLAVAQGEYVKAFSLNKKSLAIRQGFHDQADCMGGLNDLGWISLLSGNYDEARRYLRDALTIDEKMIWRAHWPYQNVHIHLGYIACELTEYSQAVIHFNEVLESSKKIWLFSPARDLLLGVAMLYEGLKQPQLALQYLTVAFDAHIAPSQELNKLGKPLLRRLEERLPSDVVAKTWELAKDQDLRVVINDLTLPEIDTVNPPLFLTQSYSRNEAMPDPLSDREQEVLRLIAEGYSNREIAERLYIGVSTVKTHINHIYSKLDVKSRTQAVARSTELGWL